MRHRNKTNALGRKAAHRKAMLANMASSLIFHKRIKTTVAKAKVLRTYIEPVITKSKNDTTTNRRTAFRYLRDKFAVTELFKNITPKIAEREGGYTRILKLGQRPGDNADICIIELVDFNTTYSPNEKTKTKKRRSRRGGSKNKAEVQNDVVVEEKSEQIKNEEQVEPKKEEKQKEETTENKIEEKKGEQNEDSKE
ncbi:MAG: 50S ribosomal protein L17 [Bacteroidota bacterium]|nr:50S ribosomal protein L17 [Bacteroidota bacterium]